jgi:hypothetical protein
MNSSKQSDGGEPVDLNSDVRELRLGGVEDESHGVDLADLGFVGHVSDDARQEIQDQESRAGRVLTTAARFAFRSRLTSR